MSAAVIASVAVVACSSHRASHSSGDVFQVNEVASNKYQLDLSLELCANERLNVAEFIAYISAYRKKQS